MLIDNSAVLENFSEIVTMIQLLIVMIVGLKVERHITKKEANRLLDIASNLASKTKTKLDDSLVSIGRMLNDMRPNRESVPVTMVTPPEQ